MMRIGAAAAAVGSLLAGVAARITNPHGVRNDEYGAPVWVCRDQRAPWPQLWALTRHYD
ncbi:MAG: hypothetical protein H0V93_02890 [Euzebyales bacterium]|nr:hypothetical protein [Euzebyales bacterium]